MTDRVGRYELVARLGAGAMGVVWSARDPQLDRRVAIKLVHPALARSPDAAGRLLREARAMAKLSHRAVITVYDAGEDGDQLFLAMELVEGTTLGALLRTRRPDGRDWQRWLAMFVEAGRGLAAAHDSGVLHRDFKPDNVLVDGHGRVRVGDFGLATLGEAAFAAAQSASMAAVTSVDLTTTGALLGTPVYMSPQQLRGEELDARADQFAFCVALYEALYGVRPFLVDAEGWQIIEDLAGTIERGPPTPPTNAHVPHRVRDAILRGLAAKPGDRFPDMHALLAELVRGARPPRWPLVVGGVAVLGIGALAIGLAATRGSSSATPSPAPLAAPAITPLATAKRLFELPIRATIAVSPDGKRLAIGGDRLEVRDLESTKLWSKAIDDHEDITHLEFDGESVRFGIVGKGVRRWRLATDEVTREVDEPSARWCGRTAKGDVFYRTARRELFVLANSAVVETWQPAGDASVFAPSPDRRRFAYLDSTDRFTGRIVVREMGSDASGAEVALGPLTDATAIAWFDDTTLLFATGSITSPQIERVAITPTGFGRREILYTIEAGLFGRLAAGGGRVFGVAMHPTSRTGIVDGATNNVVDLATASVAAVLGWRGEEMVAWSRSAGRVVLRTGKATTDTKIPLVAEPANATLAGDIAIITARRPGGREVIAARISDGVELWRHRAGSLAVRCAGDRHAPCYAIRSDAGVESIVAIDPATGELAGKPIYTGTIEDIAVRDDSARLLVAKKNLVLEIDPTGAELDSNRPDVSSVRSLAYDPAGGLLLAGTLVRNTYRVGRMRDGAFTTLVQTESDILTLVRPDPAGKRIAYLARVYAPEVFQLDVQR